MTQNSSHCFQNETHNNLDKNDETEPQNVIIQMVDFCPFFLQQSMTASYYDLISK